MTEAIEHETYTLEPMLRLSKDLRESAKRLTPHEARYLVDLYYTVQNYRIRSGNQVKAMSEGEEPHALVGWSFGAFDRIERSIKTAMEVYTSTRVPGAWAKSIHGIGPVIAGGLLAHLDVEKAPTAGHFWRFAGLDDPAHYDWSKGKRRPWNARLKTLCWKIGDSFKKQKGSPKDIYGKVYEQRKALEIARNESGAFAETARRTLEKKAIRDRATRECYEEGKLPAGRLDLRAMRYATKLFLAHLHHVMYEDRFDEPPPKPYALTHLGHAHFVSPPNWPLE